MPPSYTLAQKWQVSPNSWVLRFQLPEGEEHLGPDPTLPTCIAVHHNGTDESGSPAVLKKSYSPISHPSREGEFDLLVKSYEPRHGGGVGAHICSVEPGDGSISAKLKAKRMMHGSPTVSRRWKRVGLVAGGTGLAPLLQIARIVLADPDDEAKVQLLFVNRRAEDILMKDELDRMAEEHSDRFSVTYSLTGSDVPESWSGERGRGDLDIVKKALPPPAGGDGSTMVLVCGMDGFVDTWGGPVCRGPPKTDGSKGPKIQGPLLGLLKEAGYDESEVFKY
eukprot:CAMPEP_0113554448 /NCGR_PEP_ID=MMETSP0015_2-20120614/16154_1 /TAXON_ID=2838 /ORGANISM="Odontella" /LENGTH=278 /DNA_ID=CAMNT_0000455589 /DNA_START=175 /DNA_END=1011 /DNA_ORIENTATION=+ /assembly_acc=CAM_ASM_000160